MYYGTCTCIMGHLEKNCKGTHKTFTNVHRHMNTYLKLKYRHYRCRELCIILLTVRTIEVLGCFSKVKTTNMPPAKALLTLYPPPIFFIIQKMYSANWALAIALFGLI